MSFLDCFPTEYSAHGVGDYRESSIRVKTKGGHSAVLLTYVSHEIYKGKDKLKGLPATFGNEDEVTTLAITCEDKVIGLKAILRYSVFEKVDAIARSVEVINAGNDKIILNKGYEGYEWPKCFSPASCQLQRYKIFMRIPNFLAKKYKSKRIFSQNTWG